MGKRRPDPAWGGSEPGSGLVRPRAVASGRVDHWPRPPHESRGWRPIRAQVLARARWSAIRHYAPGSRSTKSSSVPRSAGLRPRLAWCSVLVPPRPGPLRRAVGDHAVGQATHRPVVLGTDKWAPRLDEPADGACFWIHPEAENCGYLTGDIPADEARAVVVTLLASGRVPPLQATLPGIEHAAARSVLQRFWGTAYHRDEVAYQILFINDRCLVLALSG